MAEKTETPREVMLWGDTEYKVAFDTVTGELIYRIKVPIEKMGESWARAKYGKELEGAI